MYNIELQQNFASDFNEKCHQVALLVRKAESKHENENISTKESLLGVPGVSKNQKLSTEGVYVKRQQCLLATHNSLVFWQQNIIG